MDRDGVVNNIYQCMDNNEMAVLFEKLKNTELAPEEKLQILKDMNTSLEDFHVMMREFIDSIKEETVRKEIGKMGNS